MLWKKNWQSLHNPENMDTKDISLGKIAYDAYCAHRSWKSIRGEPLPSWDNQGEELRGAWTLAALAVRDHVGRDAADRVKGIRPL